VAGGYPRSTPAPRRHGFCWQRDVAKSRDVRVRSFDFACDVVALHRSIQLGDWTTRRLSNQLLAAGTSIGANLAEAASGQTRADFIAKNCIALKEARETHFWLRVIARTTPSLRDHIAPLALECDELIAMVTALVNTAMKNAPSAAKRPIRL
jgi:four helix bundle protein